MNTGRSLWRILPKQIRELPADLAAILGLVILTNAAVFVPLLSETPLRVVFGLLFVFVAPGYAIVAALFPEASPSAGGIDGIERAALSFGLSIAIVPLVGLVLNFTPWGLHTEPILVSVSALTVTSAAVALRRRRALPPADRFHVSFSTWASTARTELFDPDTRLDTALNVLLVLGLLLAVTSVGLVAFSPQQGEPFTEFYLLTEQNGELVADGYPTNFTVGESRPLTIGIRNNENEQTTYTVVVELQRTDTANNSTRVLERNELDRFTPTLADNETWNRQYDLMPTMTGDDLRVTFLLYKNDTWDGTRPETPYRRTYLRIDVSAADTQRETGLSE